MILIFLNVRFLVNNNNKTMGCSRSKPNNPIQHDQSQATDLDPWALILFYTLVEVLPKNQDESHEAFLERVRVLARNSSFTQTT